MYITLSHDVWRAMKLLRLYLSRHSLQWLIDKEENKLAVLHNGFNI